LYNDWLLLGLKGTIDTEKYYKGGVFWMNQSTTNILLVALFGCTKKRNEKEVLVNKIKVYYHIS